MACALAAVIEPTRLTAVVNVGDDEIVHGAYVAADLDTVMYTLAGVNGEHGWGRRDDTWTVMDEMARLGADASFRLGDLDLATCLRRTDLLHAGVPLSAITAELCKRHGVAARVVPVTDDAAPTLIQVEDGTWLSFQEYFVRRRHRDRVRAVDFSRAESATPSPGVLARIAAADLVVIAPSNPPLSIWPILAVDGVREAVAAASRVAAVSPLFGGRALKGPAVEVMESVGLPRANAGVLAAYEGLLSDLVVDIGDGEDVTSLDARGVRITALDTRIGEGADAERFGSAFLGAVVGA